MFTRKRRAPVGRRRVISVFVVGALAVAAFATQAGAAMARPDSGALHCLPEPDGSVYCYDLTSSGGGGYEGGGSGGGSGGGAGSGGGSGSGGSLPEVGSGWTTCHLIVEPFECEYSDYRTPIDGTIRECYWTEFGTRRHSIPCG